MTPLLDAVVLGVPASLQASGGTKRRWKSQVIAAASAALPVGFIPVTDIVAVRFVYYHDGSPLDTDNMVKPIQDALEGIVYVDDAQVTKVVAEKRDLNEPYIVRAIPSHLALGFMSDGPFVHIRVELATLSRELI